MAARNAQGHLEFKMTIQVSDTDIEFCFRSRKEQFEIPYPISVFIDNSHRQHQQLSEQ